MKNIVILNAYGQKNIGDEAIQYSAFSILDTIFKKIKSHAQITILCEDPQTFPMYRFSSIDIYPQIMPYGYSLRAITELLKPFQKIIIAIKIILISVFYSSLGQVNPQFLPTNGPYSFIKKIRYADRVIGIGGGYLITKSVLKDFYGMSLTLLPIVIAKFYKKKILHLPISVGPFASKLHERLNYEALKNTTVHLREQISLDLLNKYDHGNTRLELTPDLALFLNNPARVIKSNSYWVLTAREWLEIDKQFEYEKTLASLIDYVWEKHNIKCVFIVMVRNIEEDNDEKVYERILETLNHKKALLKYVPKNHQFVQLALLNAHFSICTRMHSAILSLTVNCPFITIGYGHKGKGFMESISLSHLYMDISSVKKDALINKFNSFFTDKNIVNLKDTLKKIKNNIDQEKQLLVEDLKHYII